MEKSNELGLWGERRAAQFLMEKGYRFVAHRYRCRWGEIDLILEDGTFLVFAEVKLRKNDRFGTPAAQVTDRKQERLRMAAEHYLQAHPTQLQPRFDVVEIYAPQGMETDPVPVNHIENAF